MFWVLSDAGEALLVCYVLGTSVWGELSMRTSVLKMAAFFGNMKFSGLNLEFGGGYAQGSTNSLIPTARHQHLHQSSELGTIIMAEVVGTISFASQTTQGLIWFYRSVRDGGKEIKHLLVWLERLCVTLATLQGFLSNTTLFANLPSVQQLEKTIKDSQNGIDELGTILKKCTDTPPLYWRRGRYAGNR